MSRTVKCESFHVIHRPAHRRHLLWPMALCRTCRPGPIVSAQRSWKGDEWRGERLILLSDALRLLPATSKCLVELKGDDMSMVPLLQVVCWESEADRPFALVLSSADLPPTVLSASTTSDDSLATTPVPACRPAVHPPKTRPRCRRRWSDAISLGFPTLQMAGMTSYLSGLTLSSWSPSSARCRTTAHCTSCACRRFAQSCRVRLVCARSYLGGGGERANLNAQSSHHVPVHAVAHSNMRASLN